MYSRPAQHHKCMLHAPTHARPLLHPNAYPLARRFSSSLHALPLFLSFHHQHHRSTIPVVVTLLEELTSYDPLFRALSPPIWSSVVLAHLQRSACHSLFLEALSV